MYSLGLVFEFWKFQKIRGVTSFSTDLNPTYLTDLEYESRNKLTTTPRDGLINM